MRIVASIVLLAAGSVLAFKLATAPLFRVYSSDECLRAYAAAHSRADSARIDFHPSKGNKGVYKSNCLDVRAVHTAAGPIPGVRQP